MDYEKKYKEEIDRATQLWECGDITRENLEYLFPELKESEDEKIRKAIIEFFESQDDNTTYSLVQKKDILAWLEKQCEKKSADDIQKLTDIKIHQGDKNNPYDMSFEEAQNYITKRDFDICWTDCDVYVDDRYIMQTIANVLRWADDNPKQLDNKVEPKYNVMDWVTNGIETVQITGYDIDYGYQVDYKGKLQHRDTDIIEKEYHLWSIQDAKDGDVLSYNYYDDEWILIFKNIIPTKSYDVPHNVLLYHALFTGTNFYDVGILEMVSENHGSYFTPATKEQCDILEKGISASGHEWDTEKKELKKIEKQEDKPTIRERYENIGKSEWFKRTHEGMSVSNDEESQIEGIEWLNTVDAACKE